MRNDSAAISGGTSSVSFLADCARAFCTAWPLCDNITSVPDLPCLVHSTPFPDPKHPPGDFAVGSNLFGALPWICHSMLLVYRHTMDESILRATMPLLKRAANLYTRTAVHGDDGRLHLPMMFSPECVDFDWSCGRRLEHRRCLRRPCHSLLSF